MKDAPAQPDPPTRRGKGGAVAGLLRRRAVLGPGPGSLFPLGTRLAALGLVVAAFRARAAGGPGWVLLVAAFAGIAALRVPRRQLVLDLAAGFLLVALAGGLDPAPLACAAAAVALCIAAPEEGPAPLNGLDRYFIAQEYPGMAANSHHFVDLDRPLDRAALETAIGALMAEVPLCRSFIREAPLGVERFAARRPFISPAALLDWHPAPLAPAEECALLDAPFDLARRPPFRLLCAPRAEGGWRLTLSNHHSMADGSGGVLLLSWLVRRYNEARGGRAGAPLGLPPLRRFRRIFRPRGPGWLLRMIRRHVRPLDKVGVQNASLLDDESPRPSGSRHAIAAFGAEDWEGARAAARARGVTRNDILVAASLRAALAFRRRRGRPDRRFRLLFPTDIRSLLGLPPSLQNFVGVIRAEFDPEEIARADLETLVSARVRLGRTLEEAIETPVNLGFLAAVLPPFLFRRALRAFDADPRSFFFSYLWSNIRLPPDFPVPDGARIERLWIRGSIPRQPGFGLVVVGGEGEASIVAEYLEALVSEASVAEFLALFVAEVRRALAALAPRSEPA
jgi:NRPS condensation-like uncharacterized protein